MLTTTINRLLDQDIDADTISATRAYLSKKHGEFTDDVEFSLEEVYAATGDIAETIFALCATDIRRWDLGDFLRRRPRRGHYCLG